MSKWLTSTRSEQGFESLSDIYIPSLKCSLLPKHQVHYKTVKLKNMSTFFISVETSPCFLDSAQLLPCAINASCAALAFAGIPMKHLAGKLSIFLCVTRSDFIANKSQASICCSCDWLWGDGQWCSYLRH